MHLPPSPGCRQPWKERCESRRGRGISGDEDTNFCWRSLERLSGRDKSLITVVSICLKLDANDSSASWDL